MSDTLLSSPCPRLALALPARPEVPEAVPAAIGIDDLKKRFDLLKTAVLPHDDAETSDDDATMTDDLDVVDRLQKMVREAGHKSVHLGFIPSEYLPSWDKIVLSSSVCLALTTRPAPCAARRSSAWVTSCSSAAGSRG